MPLEDSTSALLVQTCSWKQVYLE